MFKIENWEKMFFFKVPLGLKEVFGLFVVVFFDIKTSNNVVGAVKEVFKTLRH